MTQNQPQINNESPTATTRRIRKKFNIYMDETSKYNPFGANSLSSTYEEKQVFKYNLMKQFIRLTSRDALYKQYQQSRFLGTMILGFVGGYFAAFAITTILMRGKNIKTDTPAKWDILLYPLLMTTGFGYEYLESHKRYNKNVCNYILNKYLAQAVQNGFQDYQISK